MKYLHINCDMAESDGERIILDDLSVLPFVDAVNIACGFHGGSPLSIETTLKSAISLKKQIGAHPSYPDRAGFGRKDMALTFEELAAVIRYQISAVKGMTEALGGSLNHVKAHGALYNKAVRNYPEAKIFAQVVYSISSELKIYAPHGSEMAKAALECGIEVIYESFADRRYLSSGDLLSRSIEGSVIDNPERVLDQVKNIMQGRVETEQGEYISIKSDTICVHGDHPNILAFLMLIRNQKDYTCGKT